jgi:hypothetical protein
MRDDQVMATAELHIVAQDSGPALRRRVVLRSGAGVELA